MAMALKTYDEKLTQSPRLDAQNSHARTPAQSNGDVTIVLPADFQLESGDKLNTRHVKLGFYGNSEGEKILCLGGISATRIVADSRADDWADDYETAKKGWWRDFVSHGGAVDLDRYCVIGFDFLPGNDTDTITITTHDQARALAYALSATGTDYLDSFIGCSYGGMVALAFASLYPQRVGRLCIISAADRAHPAAIAQRGVQRRILQLADSCNKPEEGVALARQLAMISYRSADEFNQRFTGAASAKNGDSYDVCDYLIARGKECAMSLHCYMTLSDSIDRHRVDPATIKAPVLLIGSDSDHLVFPSDMRRLQTNIECNCEYKEISSLFGHDAFLKEAGAIGPLLTTFLAKNGA